MNDKNGIPIICENCRSWADKYEPAKCYVPQCPNHPDYEYCIENNLHHSKTSLWSPSARAYEARIVELQGIAMQAAIFAEKVPTMQKRIAELESRKPRAKRLNWVDEEYPFRATIGYFDSISFKIQLENDYFGLKLNTDHALNSLDFFRFASLDEAKQAAQEWLDKLVAGCAEMANTSQVPVERVVGTCAELPRKSEADNGK